MRMEGGGGGGGGAGVGGCLGLGHGGEAQIKGTHTHGGRYVQYNVYGNLFEVSAKYVPPIRPVGRGSCGIIWCVPPSSSSIAFVRAHSPHLFFSSETLHGILLAFLVKALQMGPTTTQVAVHRLLQETIRSGIYLGGVYVHGLI
jgi:hypothetical protein